METVLTLAKFQSSRRELLLDYKTYEYEFNESIDTFNVVAQGIREPHPDAKAKHFMSSAQQRAWDAINHLTICYSAGHTLDELHSFYPTVLEYWESYAQYDLIYDATPEGATSQVAQLPLMGDGFDQANRLTCFAILLGHGQLLPRLMPIVDYNNPARDAMLERLFAFYVDGRGTPPDECTRHLPYFKTLKIFNAASKDRPELMAEYLEDWYDASRRETYHDSHERSSGIFFNGYWSWEAAAISFLLDIDDSSYRDAQFYPKDLVEFARNLNAKGKQASDSAQLPSELQRCEGGQPCPETGLWFTPAKTGSQQIFTKGDTMPIFHTDYGMTIWYWVQGQVRHM
jgi:hypothetical protein